MKIFLINHFPLVGSGSGTYVGDIAKNLTEKGHEVCIIMPENTTNISKIEGVKIHPVFFKREEIIEGQLNFNFPYMDNFRVIKELYYTIYNYITWSRVYHI